MVALRAGDAERFLSSEQARAPVWLVHGADHGLVDDRIQTITRLSTDDPSDPLQIVRLEGEQIADGSLLDEWRAISLFATRRTIRIDLGARDIVEPVRQCLETPSAGCTLVIRAGLLKRDAPLRLLCEKSKMAVALECPADSPAVIRQLILDEVERAGAVISDGALQAMTESLGSDRATTKNEIEKLLAYAAGQRHIAIEDVQAAVTDAAPRLSDAAIGAMMAGDLARADLELERAASTSSEYQAILGNCLRLYLLVQRACADVEAGGQAQAAHDRALRQVGPQRRSVELALAREDGKSSLALVEILRDATGRARRDPHLAPMVAARAFWSVALRAARRPGR